MMKKSPGILGQIAKMKLPQMIINELQRLGQKGKKNRKL